VSVQKNIIAFLKLSRLPFLTPGLAPFTAGVLLGYLLMSNIPYMGLLLISYVGLALIMFATYYANEYFDYEGDVINKEYNKFSGGSRVLSEGLLPRRVGLLALTGTLIVMSIITITYMMFYYSVRPLLALLAIIGITAGIFYSCPPFRWAYRGIGELWIGFAYGWLTVTSGYYIVTSHIDLTSTLLSLPPAFTVFAVIVINEFPDYSADAAVGKRNLVVRLGRDKARFVYGAAVVAAGVSGVLAGYYIGGLPGLLTSTLLLILSLYLFHRVVVRRVYLNPSELEFTCALTILFNAFSAYPPILGIILNGVF